MNHAGFIKSLLPLILLCLLFDTSAHATGSVQGAKIAGMGTAFVAVADDPSAIAVNPAGLTQLKGTNIYGGMSLMFPSTTYISPSGEKERTDFQVFTPPHFYISSDAGQQNLRLAFGIYSLYGIGGRKWDRDGLTRYITTKSLIGTISANPTVAYQISKTFSIGAGLNYMYAISQAEAMVNQSLAGAGDAHLSLDAKGDGWGYNFGILFSPAENFRMGLAYRSRIKVGFDGEITLAHIAPAIQPLFGGSELTTDAHSTLTFPDIWSFGISYLPSEKLTIAIDAEYVGWSSFKKVDIDIEREVPAAGFSDRSTPHDWKNSWMLKAGGEYRVNTELALRAGYTYVETPVPDKTLDPVSPEPNQHNVNIGFGYRMGKYIIDFFYNAGIMEDRKVHNNILDGEYKDFTHYTGLSVGRSF